MKKLLIATVITLLMLPAFAQTITKITFADNGSIVSIAYQVDDNAVLNLNEDGTIINWGVDLYKERGVENYQEKLEKFMGRAEYYDTAQNEAFRGKVKYIGKTLITYYASYDGDEFKGKVKSIGTSTLDYYKDFEDAAYKRKLKTSGPVSFSWYSAFDNEAIKGKLKASGSTSITYYASFDDKAYKGKIKSVGSTSFTYYSSFDRQEYRGRMKSGSQIVMSNGIKYYIRGY